MISAGDLARIWPEAASLDPAVLEQVEVDAKYAVYLDRQSRDIEAFRRDEALAIPADLDFDAIDGLPTRRGRSSGPIRPSTVGQAGRIDGITPAALTLLMAAMRKGARRQPA